jgi:hypothetical protein
MIPLKFCRQIYLGWHFSSPDGGLSPKISLGLMRLHQQHLLRHVIYCRDLAH